jgi:thiol-disulfide isomerase/thioredoxin
MAEGCGLALCLLLVAASGSLSAQPIPAQPERLPLAPGEVLNAALLMFSNPDVAQPEGRVVLAEDYTATWCPPCADADGALTRLLDERSPAFRAANVTEEPSRLALLQMHPWPDLGRVGNDADPFGVPEGSDRMQEKYGAFWFPTTVFDGVLRDEPDPGNVTTVAGGVEAKYATYRLALETRLAIPAAAEVSVTGDLAAVTVTIVPNARVGARDLVAYVALAEDHVPYAGSNGVADHRFTLRALLEPETWRGPEGRTFTRELSLSGLWNASRLSAVAWVETEKPVPEAAAQANELFLFAVGSAVVLAVGLVVPSWRAKRAGGS